MAKRVAALATIAWHAGFAMDILAGIRDVACTQPNWTVRYILRELFRLPHPDANWAPDVAILADWPENLRKFFPTFKGPVVTLLAVPGADVCVVRDDLPIGRMAASHLVERGFRHFGYVPFTQITASEFTRLRLEGFQETLSCHSLECSVGPVMEEVWKPDSPIVAWIKTLPRPAGVFCTNDQTACQFMDACRACDVRVPEEIAVIGADNDRSWCETASPPLSSVDIGWRECGRESVRWAQRLLRGRKPPRGGQVLMPPQGVVTRRSTDSLPIADADVAKAVAYLRQHACDGIGLKHVLAAVAIDRRRLERAFRTCLGRSPHEEILRVQIERAKEILTRTGLSVPEVGSTVGLSRSQFIDQFQKITGQTPSEFRESCRLHQR